MTLLPCQRIKSIMICMCNLNNVNTKREEKMRRNYWDTLYVNLTWANCYASAPPLSGFKKKTKKTQISRLYRLYVEIRKKNKKKLNNTICLQFLFKWFFNCFFLWYCWSIYLNRSLFCITSFTTNKEYNNDFKGKPL